MNITIVGRKCTPRDAFKERAEKKLAKIERFFGEDATAKVTATVEKTSQTVEVTVISAGGLMFRAQQRAENMNDALDECVDLLVRQIRKNKTRVEKKMHSGSIDDFAPVEAVEEEVNFEVVRTKTVALKPESVDEAILQMNLLGHQFYMFRNSESGIISVVYRRNDGGYGILEPEQE